MWQRSVHGPSRRSVAVALALLAGGLVLPAVAPARCSGADSGSQDVARPDAREPDRAAIRELMRAVAGAIGSRDASALAALWTADGEYISEDGTLVRGRAALEKAYKERFARSEAVKITMERETIRFLGQDTAVEDGSATVVPDPTQPSVTTRYSALIVRENGSWRIAQFRELSREAISVRDLDWLVGSWKSGEAGNLVETTYVWDNPETKTFLRVQFTIKTDDRTLTGTQIIGVDPQTGELRNWTFESEGGIGEAVWNRDQNQWIIEAIGTLADGSELVATNILTQIDADTFTWQSINRTLDGEPLPDLPPTKVMRIRGPK
jgi:uncharacterized protein (TIGR02246 family)